MNNTDKPLARCIFVSLWRSPFYAGHYCECIDGIGKDMGYFENDEQAIAAFVEKYPNAVVF